MILSQKNIEEIAVAVIRDFQKSFFGSEADDPTRFALPTPIDQFASDYLNLKVSFQKLSSDGSIYGLTAYVDTEYQIEVDGSQRSIFLKTNDVVLDKSFIELENIRKLCGKRRFTLAHECAHQILFQLDSDDRKIACHKRPEVRGNGSRVLKTQEELAVRLGLASKQHVSRMENGERSCSIDLLIELSCILHVSTDYLLMGSEPSKEEVKNDLLSIISELSTIAKKI